VENNRRILIVDDDLGVSKTLKLIFEKNQYETESVGTGQEALKKAKENFFNMAFLDIKLPDMQGVELIGPLKELHPDIVVIMITAFASMETAVQAINDGASAYIYKPLEMDKVLKIVENTFEKLNLIEEKRKAEKALKESEEKLKKYSENLEQIVETRTNELKISEERYRGLYESSIDDIFSVNMDNNDKPTYFKSTGLGLSVTKTIVETHGGQIWAFSEGEGKGATFIFTLPKHKIMEAI
jgi:ActR/RegA family two-component response regulator